MTNHFVDKSTPVRAAGWHRPECVASPTSESAVSLAAGQQPADERMPWLPDPLLALPVHKTTLYSTSAAAYRLAVLPCRRERLVEA